MVSFITYKYHVAISTWDINILTIVSQAEPRNEDKPSTSAPWKKRKGVCLIYPPCTAMSCKGQHVAVR
jgi:hypothetical protein